MRPEQLALLIPIFSVLGAFTMIIFLRRYQNIERMSMIERGMNPAELKNIWRKRIDPYRHIRIACTAIGIGLGLFIGSLFRGSFSHTTGGTILAGSIFIFGGAGLLAGYIVQMGLESKARKEGRNSDGDEI